MILLGLVLVGAGTGALATGVLSPESQVQAVPPTPEGSPELQRAPTPTAAPPSPSETPPLLRSVEEEVATGSGDLEVVPGESEVAGDGPLKRYLVEVEGDLPGDPQDFAAAVEEILGDPRSWGGDGEMSTRRVDEGPVDFRVALTAPGTVDFMCAPLQTNGYVSCTQGGRAVINQNRWVSGVDHFDGDLETYRIYVINHEVGHALGHGHVGCPGTGEPAPVMQQQTFGLQGCEKNGWVHP
ncbi:hypothetical protein HDA32_000991 [Spinactinospora alkalitolerans]|uniref:DUF3152 domain-containing protein n=1 Tax=Spinactinospora alkalitolerans TaxID=687207 RepID=A0A852TQP4_9ACTN|nr:hypothetical protein [Spinactinospora alkalitolerans]